MKPYIVFLGIVAIRSVLALVANTSTSSVITPEIETLWNEECPQCDMLFSKLEKHSDGRFVQNVEIQERAEPKSGTGFMFEWAGGALVHTCAYLNSHFGHGSCTIYWEVTKHVGLEYCTLTFEPQLGVDSADCPCNNVERVSISASSRSKHQLPMSKKCPLKHALGLPSKKVCTFTDGRRPQNYVELMLCVKEIMRKRACAINDHREQMIPMRDPRPEVVSAYFEAVRVHHLTGETVDEYATMMLPIFCQWMAIRYTLATRVLNKQSTVYWYDNALNDPLTWHYSWLHAAGLQLPRAVVIEAAEAAKRNEFSFVVKGVDTHPGGEEVHSNRSYEHEISPDTLQTFDSVLRTWLPPVLLDKFGVPHDE